MKTETTAPAMKKTANMKSTIIDKSVTQSSDGRNANATSATPNHYECRATKDLKPHPLNAKLYGDTFDDGLIESIKENGILSPLTILPDGTVIGGHRRLAAALALGLEQVPVEVMDGNDSSDVESLLVTLNIHRVKTTEARIREYIVLKRHEEAKAADRKGVRSDLRTNLSGGDSGRAREIAGLKAGLGATSAEHGRQIIEAIDKHGSEPAVDDVRRILNHKSIDAGFKRAQELGWIRTVRSRPRKDPAKPADSPEPPPTTPTPHSDGEQLTTESGNTATYASAPIVEPASYIARDSETSVQTSSPGTVADMALELPTEAERPSFPLADGTTYHAASWRNETVDEDYVRNAVVEEAEDSDDAPEDVAEIQRFMVELAGLANSLLPISASAATHRNFHHAAKWLTETIDRISMAKLNR